MSGSTSQLARTCPECHRVMWSAHMGWSEDQQDWVCQRHLTLLRPAADWSEVDGLCRERSVLLDCNDVDRVDVVLRYSRN